MIGDRADDHRIGIGIGMGLHSSLPVAADGAYIGV